MGGMSRAMSDVLNERARQQDPAPGEGFSAAQDDEYVFAQLAEAAAAYTTNAVVQVKLAARGRTSAEIEALSANAGPPTFWPWSRLWWKPRGARRNLVRAAALIVAEIERLDRAEIKRLDRAAESAKA